jgi:hypothetical protein
MDGRIILKWIFGKRERGMDWIDLARNRNRWWALANEVTDFRDPENSGNFLTGWKTISFSRRTLLHGVSK